MQEIPETVGKGRKRKKVPAVKDPPGLMRIFWRFNRFSLILKNGWLNGAGLPEFFLNRWSGPVVLITCIFDE